MQWLALRQQLLDEGDPVGDGTRDILRLLLRDAVRVMEQGMTLEFSRPLGQTKVTIGKRHRRPAGWLQRTARHFRVHW